MREFFCSKVIDPIFENFEKSIPIEARLRTLLPLASDPIFLQGITDTIPPILQLLFDSMKDVVIMGENEISKTSITYISNIDKVNPMVLRQLVILVLEYGDILKLEKDTILSIISIQKGLVDELPSVLASNAIRFLSSIYQTEDAFVRASAFILTSSKLSLKNSLLSAVLAIKSMYIMKLINENS